MSDSTPTERFDAQSGDDEPKSKTLLYALIGVGAALLIAVVILLLVLLTRPASSANVSETPIPTATTSETPSEVPSESATPVSTPTASTPTETPAPPPAPAPVPGFDSFHAPSHAGCQDGDDQKLLTFSWSSDDATKAHIGVQTTNAKTAPYESDLPPVYTYTNLYYQCGQASQIYTVTLEDGAGHLTHKTVTITK